MFQVFILTQLRLLIPVAIRFQAILIFEDHPNRLPLQEVRLSLQIGQEERKSWLLSDKYFSPINICILYYL